MPFAQHAAEMQLKETIIRVRKEDVGGNGSSLDAGFDPVVLGVNTEEGEQERVEAGYGYEVVPVTAGISDEDDEEGWTKEILVSGIVSLVVFPTDFRSRTEHRSSVADYLGSSFPPGTNSILGWSSDLIGGIQQSLCRFWSARRRAVLTESYRRGRCRDGSGGVISRLVDISLAVGGRRTPQSNSEVGLVVPRILANSS
jgi:hypothetical protein